MSEDRFASALSGVAEFLARVTRLNERHRAGEIHVRIPPGLEDFDRPLEEAVAACLRASHVLLEAASRSLFYSLPIAFDPAESVGCYLATIDRDDAGEPWRFLDMGAQIATRAFGENDPGVVEAVLRGLPYAANRYAHSEYQTVLSLRCKATLDRIAPRGTPHHFVVNTGAEAVENAIKAALLVRATVDGEKLGSVIVSFEGAFHGRTLGALAVTHRKKARTGFPTFDWPQVIFPIDDPRAPAATQRREERCLRQLWELVGGGRGATGRAEFREVLDHIDLFLAEPKDLPAFVAAERQRLGPDAVKRARRVGAVLVEPIQGEGGVRLATARFFRRLRLLTLLVDVPLIFDEVQTGFGATGRLWAHELFDLPAPPDVVTWAKKAQNGVLFVSEELAVFFQEEKKFNTTWEGDSVGMIRFLSMVDRLDLDEVRRTGDHARAGLEALARKYPELLGAVRGAGVMLAIDVKRSDWRDVLRDRAFRRGLILLPAGERALRVYPRYDTPPAVIDEALAIFDACVQDVLGGAQVPLGPRVRVADLIVPVEALKQIDLDARSFGEHKAGVMAVEIERYGGISHYPPDVLRAGARPLLQYPLEALEASLSSPRSVGLALHDPIANRLVGYAIGGALENYDEEGVQDDPRYGENKAFYLQAMAVIPSLKNQEEVESHLLDRLRARVAAAGYLWISGLIEERLLQTAPKWMRGEPLRTIENYLRCGVTFVYFQAPLSDDAIAATSSTSA
jgi:4-aminobutyrate aminotransferase / (S)-3-amino-2-methylpropionate transaminase